MKQVAMVVVIHVLAAPGLVKARVLVDAKDVVTHARDYAKDVLVVAQVLA